MKRFGMMTTVPNYPTISIYSVELIKPRIDGYLRLGIYNITKRTPNSYTL